MPTAVFIFETGRSSTSSRSAITRVGPYKTLKNYKDEGWNAVEVIVTGTKAHCTCNGEVLEAALEIPEKGPLALQSEINGLEYRHLRVKKRN